MKKNLIATTMLSIVLFATMPNYIYANEGEENELKTIQQDEKLEPADGSIEYFMALIKDLGDLAEDYFLKFYEEHFEEYREYFK